LEAGVGGGRPAAVDFFSQFLDKMPKSKASEATEQELAAMKMDMEGMNTRQEEIGGKVESVQTMMTELTNKFSRLEAMFTATLEKQAAPPEKETSKDKPSSSVEKTEVVWHDGPPHWRRYTAPEPPRYEDFTQDMPEMHTTHPDHHDPRYHQQPYTET
jgi:ribosomal protein L16 Arg81 hydroxylase